MKRITTMILALCLICALFTACNPGTAADTTPSTDAPASSVPTAQLPEETFPEKPEQDYTLPPGEKPSVPPVDR